MEASAAAQALGALLSTQGKQKSHQPFNSNLVKPSRAPASQIAALPALFAVVAHAVKIVSHLR